MKNFAPVVLRVGLSLVFLWFGTEQISNTEVWTGLIPEWITSVSGFPPASLVLFNGIFEILFGLLLLLGIFTRTTSLVLALHLFSIMFTVGYNDVGVRDFGLAMATLAVFLNGPDLWCGGKFFVPRHDGQVKKL